MNIYTTRDNGRLHLAAENYYLGSVNSYNNFFTKFFSKLFGKSMNIQINKKSRCVNIKDYAKFLKEIDVNLGVIECKNFNQLKISITQLKQSSMREHLSEYKQYNLFQKLVKSLIARNTEKAKMLVAKGADLNQTFFIHKNEIKFDEPYSDPLYHYFSYSTLYNWTDEYSKYTPAIYAALEKMTEIMTVMKYFGASVTSSGEHINLKHTVQLCGTKSWTKKEKEGFHTLERNSDGKLETVYRTEWHRYRVTENVYDIIDTAEKVYLFFDANLSVQYKTVTETKRSKKTETNKSRVY